MKIIQNFTLFVFLSASIITHAWVLENQTYKFSPIAKNVFVMHGPKGEPNLENTGFMNNPGIIIGNTGIIVVDPGSSKQVGEQVILEIEKISKKPIVAVFNTHVHGDHWLGNQAIVARYPKVKIYAHPMMIKRAKDSEGANWVNLMETLTQGHSKGTIATYPTNKTHNGQIINIGSEAFKIHNPTKNAHTNTDIMIEHSNSQTLFLGDNDFVDRMGRFDGSSDIHNNIKVLQYANDLKLKQYVPGHGLSGNAENALMPFLTYLTTLRKITLMGYEDDLSDYEIKPVANKQLSAYHHWHGFEGNLGRHINKMLLEIEDKEE